MDTKPSPKYKKALLKKAVSSRPLKEHSRKGPRETFANPRQTPTPQTLFAGRRAPRRRRQKPPPPRSTNHEVAFFTDEGISLLYKRFLPAMDKVIRVCHVYLTPTHSMLLHNLLGATATGPDGGGPQCVAQFARDLLFRDYSLSSRNGNRIAFVVDVALLHRALRSVLAVHAQSPATGDAPAAIQARLVNKLSAGSRSAAPFLTLETKGARAAVVQDVPISRPLSRSNVERLQAALEAAQELPQTLVQVPDQPQFQSLVDRLKNVGDLLTVAVTQYGDLHLQVSTSLVTVGLEFRKLPVLGDRCKIWH